MSFEKSIYGKIQVIQNFCNNEISRPNYFQKKLYKTSSHISASKKIILFFFSIQSLDLYIKHRTESRFKPATNLKLRERGRGRGDHRPPPLSSSGGTALFSLLPKCRVRIWSSSAVGCDGNW